MSYEQERQPADQEKGGGKFNPLKAALEFLLRKIKELSEKRKLSFPQKKELKDLEKELEKRKKEYRLTNHGRETYKLKNAFEDYLDKAIKGLQTASDKDYSLKKTELDQIIKQVSQQSQEHYGKRPTNLDERLAGLDRLELDEILAKAKNKRDEEVVKRGEKPRVQKEGAIDDRMKEARDLEERVNRGEQISMEEWEKLKEAYRGYGYSNDLLKVIARDPEIREREFEVLLRRFGMDSERQFRETDLESQAKWVGFMLALSDNPDQLQSYTLRFNFEEHVHNLNLFLGGHIHVDKVPDVMGQFKSRMLDVATRQPGVGMAFRAYEQGVDKIIFEKGFLDPNMIGYDVDLQKHWLDNWVKKRVENSLKNYCFQNGMDYEKEFAPKLLTFIRTGKKVFTFTLRADEIQASLGSPRKFLEDEEELTGSPYHEDLWRRLDPLSLLYKYWEGKKGPEAMLNLKEGEKLLSRFYYFYTGNIKENFNKEDWAKAMKEIEASGAFQLNVFNIGGILSKSHWRAANASKHIPQSLARFLGIEMEYKREGHDFSAKEKALRHGRKRNPLRLFKMLYDDTKGSMVEKRQEQDFILNQAGISRQEFNDWGYDLMSEVQQNLVYETQEGLKKLIFEKDEKGQTTKVKKLSDNDSEVKKFLVDHSDDGLDFSFIEDKARRAKLENFYKVVQSYFSDEKDEKGNFQKLVKKEFPFSMGTDDVPLEVFRFSVLGDMALQRRFRDLGAAARATEAFLGTDQ